MAISESTRIPGLSRVRRRIVEAGKALAVAGVLSPSHHGNISVRLPDTELILLTGASAISALRVDDLALLDLDGQIIEGRLAPSAAEIIRMHTGIYRKRADVGAVIHTHSPFVTTFAVANVPLPVVAEPLVRFGIVEPVPVAAYAPRGSDAAVANIVEAVGPETRAVLLQNHGALAFAETLDQARHLILILEETAQSALRAAALGGATEIPPAARRAAQERAAAFEAHGALTAAEHHDYHDHDHHGHDHAGHHHH